MLTLTSIFSLAFAYGLEVRLIVSGIVCSSYQVFWPRNIILGGAHGFYFVLAGFGWLFVAVFGALVAQRIVRPPSKRVIQVRFLAGVPS